MWLKETEEVLNMLSNEERLKGFVFFGGSALSYYLQHRLSEDVDLFSVDKQLKQRTIEDIMIKIRNKGHKVTSLVTEDMTIQRDFEIDNVKTTFLVWSLEGLKTDVKPFRGSLKIASLDLLAGMKAYAFGRRTEIRDAYDLFVLFKEIGVSKVMDSASNFFGELFSKRLFINQLNDLSRIKESRIEDMLEPKYKVTKAEIQAYFENEIKEYIEKELVKSKNQSIAPNPDSFF
jgi:hypothetical protein